MQVQQGTQGARACVWVKRSASMALGPGKVSLKAAAAVLAASGWCPSAAASHQGPASVRIARARPRPTAGASAARSSTASRRTALQKWQKKLLPPAQLQPCMAVSCLSRQKASSSDARASPQKCHDKQLILCCGHSSLQSRGVAGAGASKGRAGKV
jgi:hypothetical protein